MAKKKCWYVVYWRGGNTLMARSRSMGLGNPAGDPATLFRTREAARRAICRAEAAWEDCAGTTYLMWPVSLTAKQY